MSDQCSGADAWKAIRCVATDGAAAFPHALQQELPGVPHLRCLFHISENLSANLRSKLTSAVYWGEFIKQWDKCAYSVTNELEFETQWTKLLTGFPKAAGYMLEHVYPCRVKWSSAWTLQYTTFGAKSTQRLESLNHLIKFFSEANDPLSKLFETETITEINRTQIQRLRSRLQSDPLTNTKFDGPVYRQAIQYITKEAAERVHRQAGYLSNYTVKFHAQPPASIASVTTHA